MLRRCWRALGADAAVSLGEDDEIADQPGGSIVAAVRAAGRASGVVAWTPSRGEGSRLATRSAHDAEYPSPCRPAIAVL